MNYSIVRWLTVPDTWDFTDEIIEENPLNPNENYTTSAYSIATWFTTEDEWDRKFEKIYSNILIRVDNTYYTYQDGEFIEIEPTVENFEEYGVNLMELLVPNREGIKPIMTLKDPEIVYYTDKENPKLQIRGYRDLRPLMESNNPKLLISSDVEPEIRVTYHPEPQLVLPDDDIKLRMLDKIHDFTIYTNKNNGGDIKIVYSTDSGRTWEVYRDGKAEEVNIANIKEVKEKGLTPDEFNSIGEVWDDIVVDDRIRFAYYLETATLNDIAEVDKLVVEMDMHGRWRKAEHINDYDYEYDNEHIYVTFYKDGSYKVNYQG